MRYLALFAGVLACAVPPGVAWAEDAVGAVQAALLDALKQAPLGVPFVSFAGRRVWHVRFTGRPEGDVVTFGVTMDFVVVPKDGTVLGGKKGLLEPAFTDTGLTSRCG